MSRFIHALQKSILHHQRHVQIIGAPVCYAAGGGGGFPRSNAESEITQPETLHNFSSIPTLNCQQFEISFFRRGWDEAFTLLGYSKGKPCAEIVPLYVVSIVLTAL